MRKKAKGFRFPSGPLWGIAGYLLGSSKRADAATGAELKGTLVVTLEEGQQVSLPGNLINDLFAGRTNLIVRDWAKFTIVR